MNHIKVSCVIVTYNPGGLFKKVIKSLEDQVDEIIIIDNSEITQLDSSYFNNSKIKLFEQSKNLGIAKAQNLGLNEALKSYPDYVLLSDQDTIYPNQFTQRLIAQSKNKANVAALAPAFIDVNKKSNVPIFIRDSKWYFPQIKNPKAIESLSQAIASGLLLNSKYLSAIGFMDESLFIDFVDLEWCWRARAKGFLILGIPDVIIKHSLGDRSINIGLREVPIRSHKRHYYMTRNALHLGLRCESLSFTKKVIIIFKSFQYALILPLLSKSPKTGFKYSYLAILHATRHKLGEIKL